jgi:UDP-glucose 4-epimerase
VNVECPVRWLRAAERVGVGRFVFLSSVKVLGDVSDRPLLPDDPYAPADAYARSKVAAERGLLDSARHSTAVALVRPPLVYGPGVGGNFQTLLRVAAGGLPLPLAGARAPRSLLAVQNLVDLLVHLGRSFTPVCADAADGIWHASDGEDLGVAELLTVLRQAFGVPRRLFNVPAPLLRAAAAATGRAALYSRLFEPLQVDTSATLGSLAGWTPPVSRDAALREAVAWFRR